MTDILTTPMAFLIVVAIQIVGTIAFFIWEELS